MLLALTFPCRTRQVPGVSVFHTSLVFAVDRFGKTLTRPTRTLAGVFGSRCGFAPTLRSGALVGSGSGTGSRTMSLGNPGSDVPA